MTKIDKEKFIKDIKKDLGIKERNCEKDYKPETFEEFEGLDKIFEKFFKNNDSNERKKDFNNPIPAHITNGQMILVRDEGNRTSNLLGHLIIKINVKH